MRFNRQTFLDETCGNLDVAFDCIDDLLSVLSGYIDDDEFSGMNGFGCYGKGAKAKILSLLKNKQINEFLDC